MCQSGAGCMLSLPEHSAAKLNRVNYSRVLAVRSESPTFLWSCVFTLLGERGSQQGGARGPYRKGNKSAPTQTMCGLEALLQATMQLDLSAYSFTA